LRYYEALLLYEAFELETESFYNLANLLCLCEAFKLETKSFYNSVNVLRL